MLFLQTQGAARRGEDAAEAARALLEPLALAVPGMTGATDRDNTRQCESKDLWALCVQLHTFSLSL
jgi:hypothetical protein